MDMYILSEKQFDEIITALSDVRFILDTCQHVELDLIPVKQPAPLPVEKPKSQPKTRVSRRKARAALTEKKVLEIKRQLQAGGKSVAKIAREFGVHSTTINCIKWGKTWKHVSLQQDQPTTVVI
jgi:hypothetical protein